MATSRGAMELAAPMPFGRFFGRAARERELPGFRLAQFVPNLPNREVAPHRHDEAHFVFILRGCYETNAEPTPDATAPRIVYSPPGTSHRDCFTAGTDLSRAAFATLSISPLALAEAERESKLPAKGVCMGESAVPLVRQLLVESAGRDDLASCIAEGLCFELLERIAVCTVGRFTGEPTWLRRARELLRDSCLDVAPRSVGEIAAALGVHPVHLARRFRQTFGLSPGQYLRRCRLERARRLMRRSSAALAEIAAAAGFADQSHFSNAFRREYGVSPGAFRRT
ncbi:MAG: AraC family transcriptional regulator [Thermoanaerobaculia bacterium]